MSVSPPPSGIVLDDTHFDCLLLGTSLTNTLLAAALAKLGKKVLHIDRSDYYGGLDTSLPFNDFARLVHHTALGRHTQAAASRADISDWRAICGDTDNQRVTFHQIVHSSPLYGATSITAASHTATPHARVALSASTAHTEPAQSAAAADGQSLSTTVPPAALLSDSPIASLVASFPPSLPPSQSRLFSLDCTPRLLLSRSRLVDVLIASSTSSYIEFKAVDQSYLCPTEREGLQQVPVSRSAVFTSQLISVNEKRQLMRLLAAVMPNHKVRAQQEEEDRKDIARQRAHTIAYT